MSRLPIGKVLLRNVIRHTDAHNKIQEESEMWKLRQWEKEVPHHKLRLSSATEFTSGQMHCDRVSNDSRDQSGSHERTSGHDEREARYWTRKLHEFEANDPDRWGHSGFKELYPEEFDSDGEKECGNKKNGHHKKKKSKSSLEAAISKRLKKSSRKKKKKRKKKVEEKLKKAEGSSRDGNSDESNTTRYKRKRKRTKSKHKSKRSERNRGREEDSSSEESDEKEREKWTNSHKKRKLDFHQGSDSGLDSRKKRRKNWKVVNDDKSDETSGD